MNINSKGYLEPSLNPFLTFLVPLFAAAGMEGMEKLQELPLSLLLLQDIK